MPQMGHDTKTDRLTDCQSQCDFDFDLTVVHRVGGWCEMAASLQGREPGSRGTSVTKQSSEDRD
jgi:hypothetical protein